MGFMTIRLLEMDSFIAHNNEPRRKRAMELLVENKRAEFNGLRAFNKPSLVRQRVELDRRAVEIEVNKALAHEHLNGIYDQVRHECDLLMLDFLKSNRGGFSLSQQYEGGVSFFARLGYFV